MSSIPTPRGRPARHGRARRHGGRIVLLDPARVKPFADNPRKRFRGIAPLALSIQTIGQVTPIVVTRSTEPGYDAELVDGERRLRACLTGGMKVRAVFADTALSKAERFARSVAGNFCRQGHDAVEIMEAVLALKEQGKTGAEIAAIFGTSEPWVNQYARLQNLHPDVLEELKVHGDDARETAGQRDRRKGKMTLTLALALVPLPREQQVKLCWRILRQGMSMEGARTFIHREAAKAGIATGTRQTPVERFRTVRAAVERCDHVIDRYLRLPGQKMSALVAAATAEERAQLEAILERLCESLLKLSDAVVPPRRGVA